MPKSETKQKQQDDVEITLPGTSGADFGDDELGQIRSLLFGEHARRTLERVNRVENQVLAAIDELRTHVDERFAALDTQFAAEVDVRTAEATALSTRVDEEATARREANIDLRTDLDRRSAEIRKQLRSATSELSERIEGVDADLRHRNVNREALAGLFEQAASNLAAE